MEKFIINGGKQLRGTTIVSGAKNVALKALVASCLTDEEVVIENVPLISEFSVMCDIIKELGGSVTLLDHKVSIQMKKFGKSQISLDAASQIRSASLFIAPLLARTGAAIIPNPGGCRIGARPIDRTIDGLKKMGAEVVYDSADGYFHAECKKGLTGVSYTFEKNTHTGTETMILAAVLAKGQTVLENAAQEPEVDELIELLNSMGAVIKRTAPRTITIDGVSHLHGTTYRIKPDRNEIVTVAIAAIITRGDVFIKEAKEKGLREFLDALDLVNAGYEIQKEGIRFFWKRKLMPTDVVTAPYPGFMTDWQSPWAVLMTQANGVSTLHETVYDSRFAFVIQLRKMGAKIELFNPEVKDPEKFYNFNLADDKKTNFHAAKISGPTPLHNAVVKISDLRAGATLVLAALAAEGETTIFGIEQLDRGYENFDKRLALLGAQIARVEE